MTLIDDVRQMQEQEMHENEIIQKLREQGANAREIEDAISQSKIKAAVYEESSAPQNEGGMQQSVTQEIPQQAAFQYPQYPSPQEVYYPQQASQVSSEMMTDIAEQIASEKLSEVRKIISEISDFKTLSEAKIFSIDERLRRIEKVLDNLQLSILNKVGSYGQSVQDMRQEMETMQDSFSKVINPLVDRAGKRGNFEPEQGAREEMPETEQPKRKKKLDGFEGYLMR